jgi:WD40 repeat protein
MPRVAWPIRDTPEHRVLLAHQKGVPEVAFSPDGRFLVSVAQDGMTKVWVARTGALEAQWAIPHCDLQSVTFHPDGRILATADWQGHIQIRSFPSGEMLRVLRMPHGKLNWALGFCAKGRYLAAVARDEIAIWELRETAESCEAELIETTREIENAFSAAMHPTRLELAIFERKDRALYRYIPNRGSPQLIPTLKGADYVQMQEFDLKGNNLRFVRDDGSIGIWNWPEQQLASVIRPEEPVIRLSATADDRWLAAQLASGRMLIYDLQSGTKQLDLPAEPSPFWCCAWSPDGLHLAGGLADGTVILWDLNEVWSRLNEFGISPAPTGLRSASRLPPAGNSPARTGER